MKIRNKQEFTTFIKYGMSAGCSFALDLGLFAVSDHFLSMILDNRSIFISTVIARIVSSLFNYYLNSRKVFQRYDRSSIFKYYALVVVQMIASASFVFLLKNLFDAVPSVILKVFVDTVIFLVNYYVQKRYIFREE